MKWRYLVIFLLFLATIALLLMFQVDIKAHYLGKDVFTEGKRETSVIIAEGWSILWRLWPVFVPAIAIIALSALVVGALLGHSLYEGDLKTTISYLEGDVEQERQRANRAEVEAAQDAHHRLEAEHQDIKRLRANLDKRQALHEEREARIENAEYEIDAYKQNIEKRALQAERERDEALEVAEHHRKLSGKVQGIKTRIEYRLKNSREQNERLKSEIKTLKERLYS